MTWERRVTFTSTEQLASALRKAAEAHHEYELKNGKDADWQTWYAAYIFNEQRSY